MVAGRRRATERRLALIYHDPRKPYALTGSAKNLQKAYQTTYKKDVSINTVNKFLSKQADYTLFHPIPKRNVPRRHIIVHAKGIRAEADLIFMTSLAKQNSGHKYILILIDCFSRFVYARALLDKTSAQVLAAINDIYEKDGARFTRLYTDNVSKLHTHVPCSRCVACMWIVCCITILVAALTDNYTCHSFATGHRIREFKTKGMVSRARHYQAPLQCRELALRAR